MPRNVLTITNAEVRFGPCPAAGTPIDPASLTDYSCQITEARISASANTISVPATFCEPASDTAGASSYSLELNGLQDWGSANSFSEFLFQNDAKVICFGLFLDGNKDPKATGRITAIAGDFGGPAGTDPLTFSSSLPILGKPSITKSDGSVIGATPTPNPTFTSGADVPPTAAADDGSVYISTGAGKTVYVRRSGVWVDSTVDMTNDPVGAIEHEAGKTLTGGTPTVASVVTTDDAVVVQESAGGQYRLAQYATAGTAWAWVGAAFSKT